MQCLPLRASDPSFDRSESISSSTRRLSAGSREDAIPSESNIGVQNGRSSPSAITMAGIGADAGHANDDII